MTLHKRSRSRALLAIPAVGALVLAGCSGSGSGDDSSFTLMYSASNNLESPFETLAKQYEKEHSGTKIKLEPVPNDTYGDNLRTKLQAGNAPEVFQTEGGTGQTRSVVPLAKAGFLAPLGEATSKLIDDSSAPLFEVGDKVYGQPLVDSYNGMIVNETALDDVGAKEFPKSFDEFTSLCSDADDKGKSFALFAGAAGPNATMTAMNISATRVYAENPDWNKDRTQDKTTFAKTQGWRDTLQTIVDLNKKGCFQKGAVGAGFDVLTNNFASGKGVSMFVPGQTAVELAEAAPDAKIAVHPFPPADAGDKAYGLLNPTYSMSLNAKAKDSKSAKKFMEWLAEPEQANKFAEISGGLPVTGLEDYDFDDSQYSAVKDLIVDGDTTPLPNSGWPNTKVNDALASGVQGLLSGQETVDSVLKSLDAAWDS